jgi:hypothetical protein
MEGLNPLRQPSLFVEVTPWQEEPYVVPDDGLTVSHSRPEVHLWEITDGPTIPTDVYFGQQTCAQKHDSGQRNP